MNDLIIFFLQTLEFLAMQTLAYHLRIERVFPVEMFGQEL